MESRQLLKVLLFPAGPKPSQFRAPFNSVFPTSDILKLTWNIKAVVFFNVLPDWPHVLANIWWIRPPGMVLRNYLNEDKHNGM